MTDTDRLAEIRARLDAASSKPWVRYSTDFREHRSHAVKAASEMVVAHTGYGPSGGTAHQDAELIAHSPGDLQWLLDEVERLNARMAVVAKFLAAREEFIATLTQCVDADADYHRWQGHAESRRVLAEDLAALEGNQA